MKKELLEKIKKELIKEKERLKKELKEFAQESKYVKDDYETKHVDLGTKEDENAAEVLAFSDLLSLERDLETRLLEVNKALEKIEKGIYGICEKCKKEIEEKRLEAFPSANLCLKCKKGK